MRLKVAGANRNVQGRASDLQIGKSNYFIGNDPRQWLTDLPHYGRVEYAGIYPGIDLVYYGTGHQLEYDFVVRPKANPDTIQLEFDGADRIGIDETGDLVLTLGGSQIRERKPVAYQENAAGRSTVEARYALLEGNRVGFEVASYDREIPLVIDPILMYSSYFGDGNTDLFYRVALDGEGNSYYGGLSAAGALMATAHSKADTPGGVAKVIAKVSPSGDLLYTTFIGGTADKGGIGGFAVDKSGNVYATGSTQSRDFPLVHPLYASFQGGIDDAYVLELNSSGDCLVFSTLLGGNKAEYGVGLGIDGVGNIYVAGTTTSANFPTTSNAYQKSLAGIRNAFIAKLSPGGSQLVYSTYFGGSRVDYSNNVLVDSSGNAYVYGDTASADFPTRNAFQSSCGGKQFHGWVAKLGPDASLGYSTLMCGYDGDASVRGAALDPAGNLVVTGETSSKSFPTLNPIQASIGGSRNAFVSKLSPDGVLLYSTYLGGKANDVGHAVAVDAEGNWYVTGYTSSANFPVVNPLQGTNAGKEDAFLTKLNAAGSAILFSTCLGGKQSDMANDIAVDSNGLVYLAGQTASADFPTAHAFQPTSGGGTDAFIAVVATRDFTPSLPGIVVTTQSRNPTPARTLMTAAHRPSILLPW